MSSTMRRSSLLFAVALVCLARRSFADVKVEIKLPQEFAKTFGVETVKPALFGHPTYGQSMKGIVYIPTNETSLLGCTTFQSPTLAIGMPTIFVLKRGSCPFALKTYNAQEAGAAAVIIVDDVDESSLPLMASDGSSERVSIPSVLISKSKGDQLISQKPTVDTNRFIVSIEWSLSNQQNNVDYRLWTSSHDLQAANFKKTFAIIADKLDDEDIKAQFTPRYYFVNGSIFQCSQSNLCGNQCVMNGKYCAMDPDHDLDSGVSGAEVVKENIRQICIFKHFTQKWWDYVAEFEKSCFDRTVNSKAFQVDCSNNAMKKVNVDPKTIDDCVKGSDSGEKNTLIEEELRAQAIDGIFMLPTLIVNNYTYTGSIDCPTPIDLAHCGPLSMICAGFSKPPGMCQPNKGCPIGQTRDACDVCYEPSSKNRIEDSTKCPTNSGASVGLIIGLLALFLGILGAAGFLYHRRSQSQMRDELHNIMSQYVPLGNDLSAHDVVDRSRLMGDA